MSEIRTRSKNRKTLKSNFARPCWIEALLRDTLVHNYCTTVLRWSCTIRIALLLMRGVRAATRHLPLQVARLLHVHVHILRDGHLLLRLHRLLPANRYVSCVRLRRPRRSYLAPAPGNALSAEPQRLGLSDSRSNFTFTYQYRERFWSLLRLLHRKTRFFKCWKGFSFSYWFPDICRFLFNFASGSFSKNRILIYYKYSI